MPPAAAVAARAPPLALFVTSLQLGALHLLALLLIRDATPAGAAVGDSTVARSSPG